MRIFHASDTHGSPSIVRNVANVDCDVIVLTGDLIQNRGRKDERGIVDHLEVRYQQRWFRRQAKKWAGDFRGRDLVYVLGNHDFIDIAPWLIHYGHPEDKIHAITEDQPGVTVQGVTFAGFREIPFIAGEWQGEAHDFTDPINRAFACNPQILVTHAPPAGVVEGVQHDYGVAALTSALSYRDHRIKAHLFGHCHESFGLTKHMGVIFSNAATTYRVFDVEV